MAQTTPTHTVELSTYLRLLEAYHDIAHKWADVDLPNCERGFCDEGHAAAMIAEEGSWIPDSTIGHELIVSGYLDDLVELYESYAEDDGLPAWPNLTQKQRDAAIRAVQQLHMNIDEYHAMVDAVEGVA